MKKMIAMVLCLVLVLSLVGCGNQPVNQNRDETQYDNTLITSEKSQDIAEAVELNGIKYTVCGMGEKYILHECGLPTELSKDLAGKHICYLSENEGSYAPIEKTDDTKGDNIKLFEYAPKPNENIYILCINDEYFAAIRRDSNGYYGLTGTVVEDGESAKVISKS